MIGTFRLLWVEREHHEDIVYAPALNFHDLQSTYLGTEIFLYFMDLGVCRRSSAVASKGENLEARVVLKNHKSSVILVLAI